MTAIIFASMKSFPSPPSLLQQPLSPSHHAAAVTPADKMAAAPSSRPFEYLESLPGTVFFKLYQQPSTALAIFRRMLPDLGAWFARGPTPVHSY